MVRARDDFNRRVPVSAAFQSRLERTTVQGDRYLLVALAEHREHRTMDLLQRRGRIIVKKIPEPRRPQPGKLRIDYRLDDAGSVHDGRTLLRRHLVNAFLCLGPKLSDDFPPPCIGPDCVKKPALPL